MLAQFTLVSVALEQAMRGRRIDGAAVDELPIRRGVRIEVGAWYIVIDQDKFTDVDNFLVATHSGNHALVFRCLGKTFSVVVLDTEAQDVSPGDKFKVIYRVDKGPVQTAEGVALSKTMIQEGENATQLSEILGKKEITLRITNSQGIFEEITFPLARSADAFTAFQKQCPAQ